MRIKKSMNNAQNIDDDEIRVNIDGKHWIKEIDIKQYGDDTPILSLTNNVQIYKYSDAMLKHMPKNALELLRYDLLYSKKKVKIQPNNEDRQAHRTNAGGNDDHRTDDNLDDRIEKFSDQLQTLKLYRISLKYIYNVGLVNQHIKFKTQWRLTFETNMQRLFESKENQAAGAAIPNTMDAKIMVDSAPYILYHQLELDDTFRTYLESAMVSENNLRIGIQKTLLLKSYEISTGFQSKTVNFTNSFKKFSFLKISLVYDKSDQHLSIYDSYNAEIASTHLKSMKLQNASNTYSEFNMVKFHLEDAEDQYTLYNAFTASVTGGSSIAPQSDYVYNKIVQQLPKINKCFSDADERVYIDIRRSNELERVNRDGSNLTVTVDLKAAAAKNVRLRVTGYFHGEYMYKINKYGLIMKYKEYGVNKQKSLSQ